MTDATSNQTDPAAAAIILAAGKGTRMQSDLPKVLHEVADRPMVAWVVDACRAVGCSPIVVVVGFREELVRAALGDQDDLIYVTQTEQLGTGHAVEVCRDAMANRTGDTFVLAGDGPLIRSETLAALRTQHRDKQAAATLATAIVDDPTGYGRIIRDSNGSFEAIVEDKNLEASQRDVREIYPSYACFDIPLLFQTLTTLPRNPIGGEYYLTELPAMLRNAGQHVEVLPEVPAEDVLSINTPSQLAKVDDILRARTTGRVTT